MLQLPQIQTASAPKITDGRPDAAAQPDQGDGFGDFLDAVTEGPLPAEVKQELVKQVEDGVPVSEVLADLLQRLRDDPDVSLVPGMVPVLQAVAPQIEIPVQALPTDMAAAAVPKGDKVAAEAVSGDKAKAELVDDLEVGDTPPADQLTGKHKALLAGRVSALEAGASVTPQATATHMAALKVLELPSATGLPAQAGGAAGEVLDKQAMLAPKVGDAQWGQALAQRVVWMVGHDKQSAELRLNPAHLGPLEVKLTLHHDQAHLSLLASNGAVRDALEQALPRLRDMLGQQDIQLAQVNVGYRQDRPDGGGQGFADNQHQGQGYGSDRGPDESGPVSEVTQRLVSRGLLDAYA